MTKTNQDNLRQGTNKWWKKNILWLIIVGVLLLASTGKLDWTAAWIYLGAILLIILLNASLMDPELMAERSGLQKGTARWDLYLSVSVAMVGPLLTVLVAGFDQRFGWTGAMTMWLQATAFLLFIAAGLLGAWAMAANRFFSSTVRLQSERGHSVAKKGPYGLIRHPGYTAGIISNMATPLVLESWVALIPAIIVVIGYIIRTALEDSFLQKNLSGYSEYTLKVPYRLIPGVW